MTAEIGLLNKSAVVIAADSAVTIGQGRRVYNNANKIYELKNCSHVGIMIYNNSNIMEIPIETIIKLYSINLTTTFKNLKDYASNFINFLSDFLRKNVSSIQVNETIEAISYLSLDAINESVEEKISDENVKEKDVKAKTVELYIEISNYILEDLREETIQKEFSDYDLEKFTKQYGDLIENIINLHINYHQLELNDDFIKTFVEIVFLDLVREMTSDDDYTGVIIAGFGEDEIYPGYIELHIGGWINDTLKWREKLASFIDNDKTVIVRPFAQRDMSDMFFRGFDSDLYQKLTESLEHEYLEIENYIHKNFRLSKQKKADLEDFLTKSINKFNSGFYETSHNEFVKPIVDTIDSFRKEDLVEIAESLISITSLKRKAASDVQTVGGPVDIAVITKGDGFKWIKAKHLKDLI